MTTSTVYVGFSFLPLAEAHESPSLLGGVARIVDAVAPAVVCELSGGVYFQLTESLDTAKSPAATEKLRAFKGLVEPLLPPVSVAANATRP